MDGSLAERARGGARLVASIVSRIPRRRQLRELARSSEARSEWAAREARHWFFHLASRFTSAVAVDTPDGRFFVATEDSVVGYYTFMDGSFDAQTEERVLARLGEETRGSFTLAGRTVLEIGANIGTQTVPLLRRWQAGHVIAIEPDAENAALLRQNIVANRLERATTVLELAATDFDGVVKL